MTKYTQGVCTDGAAILEDGVALTVDEVVDRLNELERYRDARDNWKPIDTAPMDDRELLLGWWETWPEKRWRVACAPAGNLDVARHGDAYRHGRAEYWMEKPQPPEPEDSQ